MPPVTLTGLKGVATARLINTVSGTSTVSTNGAFETIKLKLLVLVCPSSSFAVTACDPDIFTVGVPVICPLSGLNFKSTGKLGTILKVIVRYPPVALTGVTAGLTSCFLYNDTGLISTCVTTGPGLSTVKLKDFELTVPISSVTVIVNDVCVKTLSGFPDIDPSTFNIKLVGKEGDIK